MIQLSWSQNRSIDSFVSTSYSRVF